MEMYEEIIEMPVETIIEEEILWEHMSWIQRIKQCVKWLIVEEKTDLEIVGEHMTFTPMRTIDVDCNYRFKYMMRIDKYLRWMMEKKIKRRRDLPYMFKLVSVGAADSPTDMRALSQLLINTGWLPLDRIYSDKDEWLNAKMILTDESITKALKAFLYPGNRDWCYGLVEDTAKIYSNDSYVSNDSILKYYLSGI